ncbi:MAG TPA: hypothetical protein VFO58_15395 [Vicinamibacterales bacterium]|nr:hypothetical protein [Vicinamibacterales bacterium]
MRIRRALVLLPLLLVASATTYAGPIVAGDTVVLTDGPGTTGGGEFNLFVNGSTTSFVTFCLQRTEFISYNTPFRVGSVTNYADDAAGNDPIESQTAWLYTQLRLNPNSIGYQHNQTEANAFQTAIWYFENEITLTNAQKLANKYIVGANQAVANGYSGIGNVRVVNLFYMNGKAAQDQLILQVAEPATLTMFASGLLAFGAFRRRFSTRA